jgi:hypothetical protein
VAIHRYIVRTRHGAAGGGGGSAGGDGSQWWYEWGECAHEEVRRPLRDMWYHPVHSVHLLFGSPSCLFQSCITSCGVTSQLAQTCVLAAWVYLCTGAGVLSAQVGAQGVKAYMDWAITQAGQRGRHNGPADVVDMADDDD